MHVEIPLSRGRVALIDESDLSVVEQYTWHATDHKHISYAACSRNRKTSGKCLYMHRLLMNPEPDQHVDHINGNGLDNRRSNLRLCTNAQNRRNIHVTRGVSQYKGVAFCKSNKVRVWEAYIWFENRKIGLGCYETQKEAARAYNAAAIQYHGEFACLNEIEGLSYEESIIAPVRNRKPGRPRKRRECAAVGG